MESQPQNAELRINPENFHPCTGYLVIFLIINHFPVSHHFCHLFVQQVMFIGSLYCKQYGPRSDCYQGEQFDQGS